MTGVATHKLADVAKILSGYAFDSGCFADSGDLPIIRIRDVVRGYSNTFYTGDFSETFVVKNGDLLIGMDGEFNTALWRGGRAVLNQRVCKVIPDESVIDKAYLYYLLPKELKAIEDATSFVTVKHLSVKSLQAIEIPLPPLPEQKRIAAILDKADVIRRKRQQAVKLTEELLRSVFLDMFGDPVTNPKGWVEARLEDVAEIVSGVTKGRKLDGKPTVMAPYLRVANVQDGYLDLKEIKEIEVLPPDVAKYRLEVGDVLLTEGGDPDKLGRGSVWHGQVTDCIHQNHIFRVRSKTDKLMPDFLSMLIGSERGKRYFLRAAKQTTGIASINSTQLKNFPVLLPSPALQQQFAQTVTNSQKLQQRLSDAADTADSLFNSLLQRAFRKIIYGCHK